MNPPPRRPTRGRRPAPRLKWAQIAATAVILAVFIAALVIAGAIGALIVLVLSLGAGALLGFRWPMLAARDRLVRTVVVLIGLAVAVSLFFR